MRVVKKETDRRIHVLTAEKSMKRKFVGTMAAASGAVPVGRAMDKTMPAPGKIYLPDPINDPCTVRGVDTNFEATHFQVGGSLVLPKVNNIALACPYRSVSQSDFPLDVQVPKPGSCPSLPLGRIIRSASLTTTF
jgi:glycerol-3-phosphate O-acyltransferase/dihydroxyacetone phosphate acyltransferase